MKTLDLNNYKKEDMKLINAKMYHGDKRFQCDDEFTVEEKIEFCDKMLDGKASEFIRLITKLKSDIGTVIKLTPSGNMNESSLNAWLKRNDTLKILYNYDSDYKITNRISSIEHSKYTLLTREESEILLCPSTKYGNLNYTGEHVVHQIFHELLVKLKAEEKSYANSINPFHIAYNKLVEVSKGNTVFDCEPLNMLLWNDINTAYKYDITLDDINRWIKAYEELNKYTKKVSMTL
jgi:hypothetical protein